MDKELILATFERTLTLIAGDYPNATKEYKRSSFAVGAQDMCMMFVDDLPFPEKREFAQRVDEIRSRIFPK